MIDEVNYRLPLGWIGKAMHGLMVRRDLKAIFDYREQTVKRLLESVPNTAANEAAMTRARTGSYLALSENPRAGRR